MSTVETYEEACARHATGQGLDPLLAALRRCDLPAEVWQTGGFCMVVHVTCRNPRRGYVWATPDGPGTFIVCRYPEAGPDDCWGQDPVSEHVVHSIDEMVAVVLLEAL